MNLGNFQEEIGYYFNDVEILKESLTHPSFNEKGYRKNYQRLEFLGDKVLGMVISKMLVEGFTDENEGLLSKRFAFVVSCENLSRIALKLKINEVIRLGRGEELSGGSNNKNNLEDALEALIGAIYVDSGFEKVEGFIVDHFSEVVCGQVEAPIDPVSQFQEIVQKATKSLPVIEVARVSGGDHDPVFQAKIIVEEMSISEVGKGGSKKEAIKQACVQALKGLQN